MAIDLIFARRPTRGQGTRSKSPNLEFGPERIISVPDPLAERHQLDAELELAARIARSYLECIGDERVLNPDTEVAIGRWSDSMPEEGVGTLSALTELGDRAREAATRSSRARFFHFVMGGGTPAAPGADWLTSAYDQVAFAWASSPFAARLEQVAIA
jgi:hypothetical protein